MCLVGAEDRSRVKKSIVPGCVVALLLLTVPVGCEKKSGDALVIRRDYVAAVKQGEEVRDERATNHDQRIVRGRMLDNGRRSKSALIECSGRNCAKTIRSRKFYTAEFSLNPCKYREIDKRLLLDYNGRPSLASL